LTFFSTSYTRERNQGQPRYFSVTEEKKSIQKTMFLTIFNSRSARVTTRLFI